MNFSKKNHEHKIINVKNVSKRIILSMVFVFAAVSFTNATVVENSLSNNYNITENVMYVGCMEDAFRYGTEMGGGDPI